MWLRMKTMWNGDWTVTEWCEESKYTSDLESTAQEQQQQPARAVDAAVQLERTAQW